MIEPHHSSIPSQLRNGLSRSKAMHRYEIIIFRSNEDDGFIADVPELPDCKAHGDSPQEALHNAQEAIELWLDTAREFGDPIPEPKGRRLLYA
jgi:predicted RNase H-like HicB family nuclease